MKHSVGRQLSLLKLQLSFRHAFILEHIIFNFTTEGTLYLIRCVMICPLPWRGVTLSLSFSSVLSNNKILLSLPIFCHLNNSRALLPLIRWWSLMLWKLWLLSCVPYSLSIWDRNMMHFGRHLLVRNES